MLLSSGYKSCLGGSGDIREIREIRIRFQIVPIFIKCIFSLSSWVFLVLK